jgi:hypothetical protein
MSMGASGQRWLTGPANYTPGARAITTLLYETVGGILNTPSNPSPMSTQVGTAQLFYQTCTTASLQYAITAGTFAGQSGNMPLTRIGPTPRYCF